MRDRLCRPDTDCEASHKPVCAGDGYGVDIPQGHRGALKGRCDNSDDQLDMMPGRELGHYPSEGLVRAGLRRNNIGAYDSPVFDHGSSRVVARCLDSEDQHNSPKMCELDMARWCPL